MSVYDVLLCLEPHSVPQSSFWVESPWIGRQQTRSSRGGVHAESAFCCHQVRRRAGVKSTLMSQLKSQPSLHVGLWTLQAVDGM